MRRSSLLEIDMTAEIPDARDSAVEHDQRGAYTIANDHQLLDVA